MVDKIKISFSVPAYNEEKVIDKCLESIIAEINKNQARAEIIVVNNASTDKTNEIAQSYSQVRVVDETKKGLLFARQRGYLESQGELIANIDSDIILPSGWLKKVLQEFKDNDRLVGLSGPHKYYDLKWYHNFVTNLFYWLGYLTYLVNRFVLRKGSMMQGGNFVVKRTALSQIGGFNTQLKFWGEDTDIAMRLFKVGDVKFALKLFALTTGRRLQQEGVLKAGYKYIVNYFSVVFKGSPKNNDYQDHR